jgi:microcystin-dependent protein
MLAIQEYAALFSLIGTEFGGDGRTNFALPKMTPTKAESGGDVAFFINLQGIYPSRN